MTTAVKVTLAIMIPLVFIVGFLCLAWIFSPQEFTIIFQVENETLNTMNNLVANIENGSYKFFPEINQSMFEGVLE